MKNPIKKLLKECKSIYDSLPNDLIKTIFLSAVAYQFSIKLYPIIIEIYKKKITIKNTENK